MTKRFGRHLVVDGIDLVVPKGSVFGFLGPNGSGKTTTIRMLLGLAHPTAGTIEVLGQTMPAQADSVLPRVGAIVEGPAFYPWLSGRANLVRIDAVGPRRAGLAAREQRVWEALERVGLTSAASRPYRRYSMGMKQRLGLAAALLRPTELLILDEPTNGLDPQGMREVRSIISKLAEEGTTIFLSSHLLAEIEQICSHAAVMRLGKIVAQGAIGDLLAGRPDVVRIRTPDVDRALGALGAMGNVIAKAWPEPGTVRVELGGVAVERVVSALVHANVAVREVISESASLEDTFVALTGEGFDVQG